LRKWSNKINRNDGEIYFQIKKCEQIREDKLKNKSDKDENKPKNLQIHPQAIYTSRLLNFKNLSEPVNLKNYLSSFQGKF